MEPKIAQFGNRGMQQDTSISKSSNEFAFENRNIRITAVNNDTLLSVTNEKGPSQIPLKDAGGTDTTMSGFFAGHCILGKYIVIFTSTLISERDKDKIYRLEDKGSYFECVTLFTGELGLIASHPVEAIGYYESEDIQKVYWVDGINQPRFINIIRPDGSVVTDASTLNFVSTVNNFPKITVEKKYGGNGLFPAGVIQYFVTYYNKFGSETTIVGASDLNYITPQDRGGKADETVNCSFELTIQNVDSRFDYLRVYSAKRTSLDGPIEVQIVADVNIAGVNISTDVLVDDTNLEQQLVDSTILYYLGGEEFIAGTLEQKDNTLFLGNLKLVNSQADVTVTCDLNSISVSYETVTYAGNRFYDNNFELNKSSAKIKYFKAGEVYRFAIQLRDNKGKWSAPYYVGDKEIPLTSAYRPRISNGQIQIPQLIIPAPVVTGNTENHYVGYRVLMAETSSNTRRTLAQGIVNPTVFNYFERSENSPYAISSWCARPNRSGNSRHYQNISDPVEIQCNQETMTVTSDITAPDGQTVIPSDTKQLVVIMNTYAKPVNLLPWAMDPGVDERLVRVYAVNSENYASLTAADVRCIYQYSFANEKWASSMSNVSATMSAMFGFSVGEGGNAAAIVEKEDTYDSSSTEYSRYGFGTWAPLPQAPTPTPGEPPEKDYSVFDDYWCAYSMNISDVGVNANKKTEYFVDTSIVTLNSPELNKTDVLIDGADLDFRIVGIAEIDNSLQGHILNTTQGVSPFASVKKKNTEINSNGDTLTSGYFYRDGTPTFTSYTEVAGDLFRPMFNTKYASNYLVYMWHKTGSIIGPDSRWDNVDEYTGGELVHKIFATERYSANTSFFSNPYSMNICTPKVFSSTELTPIKLQVPKEENSNEYVYYYGNYDKLLAPTTSYTVPSVSEAEPSDIGRDLLLELKQKAVEQAETYVAQIIDNIIQNGYTQSTDPIRIKYKVTKEAVFSFDYNNGYKSTLPFIGSEYGGGGDWMQQYGATYFEMTNTYPWSGSFSYIRTKINQTTPSKNYLFIGELYRDIAQPYGPSTQEVLEKTKWIPCSGPQLLIDGAKLEGDTYYQRWDCLKAYPFTEEDENSVVDITSFMVESHINLDGRCDINKGGTEITSYRPDLNFNLMNDVYSQENNIFEYNILDEKYDLNTFKNQITWSLTKNPTDDIDTWTHITLLNLLNLDGTYGAITKLSCINNALFAFQDRAISRINYNDRMQISTEQNMPIEVQNSGKVQGYTYISKQIGCKNKWSICQSASGIYFTDTEKKSLYRINSEGLVDVSASTGMSTWFKDNISNNPWRPSWTEKNSVKLSYDAITNDIYVSTDKDCIVYNEGLQSFTSFLPYKMTPLLFSLDGKSLMLDSICKLYRMFAGDYNTDKDGNELGYSIKYKINPEPLVNKTFTNLDLIADYTDDNKELVGITPFSHLSIWNEHQFGETNLEDLSQYLPEDQKNKFRVWRIQLPRDKKNSRYGLDRIQNPWVYIELNKTFDWEDKEEEEIEKEKNLMTFHSLLVKYFK